jgi:hypothetical protein
MDVLESPEAKQWVSDMKDEMTKEWNRLAQMGRDVQKAVKDKDLEIKRQEESFKKQAQAYLQDIQSKDKAIRHRDMTISRMKETIANANLEKAKLQSAGATTQGNKKGGNDSVHIQQLNARLSHSQKQFDDLKRQHKALQDKVAAAQKTQTTTETPAMMDLKKKLEASTKMAEHHKKQMERLNSQVELARKDEARYKGDINRLQTEVATLKAQAKAPAGSKGGAGGGANAA